MVTVKNVEGTIIVQNHVLIVDVDGEEIECWTNNETEWGSDKPSWWGNGEKLYDAWDFDEDEN